MARQQHWKDWVTFSRKEVNGIIVLSILLASLILLRWQVLPQFDRNTTAIAGPVIRAYAIAARDTLPNERSVNWPSASRPKKLFTPASRRRVSAADSIPYRIAREPSKQTRAPLEINTADSVALLGLPGIGPYFAGKIIAFRNRLGGFHSLEQIREVWKLPPETADRILPLLALDTLQVVRININTVTREELETHPYLKKSQARAIISYREKHGPFPRYDGVLHCAAVDSITWEKIRPYIAAGNTGL